MPWLSLRQCSQPSLGLHKSISGSGRLRAQSRKEFSTFPSLSCSRTASPAGEQRLEQQCCGETASRKTQTFRPPCSPRRRHTHLKGKRNTYVIVNRGSDVLLKQLPIPIMLQQLLCVLFPAESSLMRHQTAKVLTDPFVSPSALLGDRKGGTTHAWNRAPFPDKPQSRQSKMQFSSCSGERGGDTALGLTSERCLYFPSNT